MKLSYKLFTYDQTTMTLKTEKVLLVDVRDNPEIVIEGVTYALNFERLYVTVGLQNNIIYVYELCFNHCQLFPSFKNIKVIFECRE